MRELSSQLSVALSSPASRETVRASDVSACLRASLSVSLSLARACSCEWLLFAWGCACLRASIPVPATSREPVRASVCLLFARACACLVQASQFLPPRASLFARVAVLFACALVFSREVARARSPWPCSVCLCVPARAKWLAWFVQVARATSSKLHAQLAWALFSSRESLASLPLLAFSFVLVGPSAYGSLARPLVCIPLPPL